jgi:hypothetical protein
VTVRRLRVLSEHPNLGRPNDEREEFEGAQAYIDIGLAEWVSDARAVPIETTEQLAAPEVTSERPPVRRRTRGGRT